MPPCEALTITAPRASAPATRVMLSATTTGAGEGGMRGAHYDGRSHDAGVGQCWTRWKRLLPLTRPLLAERPPSPRKRGGGSPAPPPGLPRPACGERVGVRGRNSLALALWRFEQGGGAVFDAAGDRLGEKMQEAGQAELDL